MTLTLLRNGRIHTGADPTPPRWPSPARRSAGSAVSMPSRWPAPRIGSSIWTARWSIPGFVDAHVHTTDAGLALTGLDLSGARSLAECLAAVRAFAATHPDGVLWGHGWEETRWPENRPPTRAEIDDGRRQPARLSVPGRRAFRAGQHALADRITDGAGPGRLVDNRAGHPAGPRRGASLCQATTLDRRSEPPPSWRSCGSGGQRDRRGPRVRRG